MMCALKQAIEFAKGQGRLTSHRLTPTHYCDASTAPPFS
jgi:hypothetical protein